MKKEDEILEQLMQINVTTGKMLAHIIKPQNRFMEVVALVATIVGAASVVTIIDQILRWIGEK
jgi:hypothetical protein